ncbi:prepilin peptidase [Aromatoleum sp.]|uniref:prepilin peptidase n=1 Tax=Aromatoleum sp. TaxID=2307007 RepID=UPI002FC7148F
MLNLLNDSLVFAVLAAVLGLFVGSFLNVVIHRLPRMMEREWHTQAAELHGEPAPDEEPFNLATPRSRCPHCGHQIGALENIPVISYVALRGRCRHCNATIGRRYPIVELLTAVLSGYAAWHFGFGLAAAGALLFLWAMIALAFIDLDTQLLPDSVTLPLVWIGLVFNLGATYAQLPDAVVGAIAGYLSLWSVYWLFKLVTGKEGMGYGDFKLLAAIGAWLGWQMLPLTILFSSLVGAVTGVGLIVVKRHGRNVPIPFGPYLAAAGVIALFWGDSLTTLYLGRL